MANEKERRANRPTAPTRPAAVRALLQVGGAAAPSRQRGQRATWGVQSHELTEPSVKT